MTSTESIASLLEQFSDHISTENLMYSKVSAEISTQIAKARLRHNMSQKEFAKKLGCTQAYISNIESGECNFTLRKISQIAVKLDMDLEVKLKPNGEKISRHVMEKIRHLESKENIWKSYTGRSDSNKIHSLKTEGKINYV